MELEDEIKSFAENAKAVKKNIRTEEATKTSLIMPMFQLLGYNVFDATEFCPEYTADVGVKKGERVDYAILDDGKVEILIECKSCTESLNTSESVEKYANQLFRYFGTTSAKIGILTNGLVYKFYSDIEKANVMDLTPFLEINITDLKDEHVTELIRFSKDNFNRDEVVNNAGDLKCASSIIERLQSNLSKPDDEFVKLLISDFHSGVKTQKVIDRYRPIVKRAFTDFVKEIMTTRFNAAMSTPVDTTPEQPVQDEIEEAINTTKRELEAYSLIRGMLMGTIPFEDIAYRDAKSYFSILYQDNNRKPICRLILEGKKQQILLPDERNEFKRIYIDDLSDLSKQRSKLIKIAKRYISDLKPAKSEPDTPTETDIVNQTLF